MSDRDRVLLVSFPKSGSNWVRYCIEYCRYSNRYYSLIHNNRHSSTDCHHKRRSESCHLNSNP